MTWIDRLNRLQRQLLFSYRSEFLKRKMCHENSSCSLVSVLSKRQINLSQVILTFFRMLCLYVLTEKVFPLLTFSTQVSTDDILFLTCSRFPFPWGPPAPAVKEFPSGTQTTTIIVSKIAATFTFILLL